MLEDTIKKLDSSFVDMMKKAEQKNMMHFVIDGDALKRKSEEKVEHLLKRRVEELQIKKKKLVYRTMYVNVLLKKEKIVLIQ